jgi:hypothetical protein
MLKMLLIDMAIKFVVCLVATIIGLMVFHRFLADFWEAVPLP